MIVYRLLTALTGLLLWPLVTIARLRGVERVAAPERPEGDGPLLWLHGASNGELTAARPVMEALLARHPDLRLVATANTVSGRDLVRGWALARTKARLAPYDLAGPTGRFFDVLCPAALVVVENEIWPNRLRLARARGVPVLMLSARLSARSARRWNVLPGFARNVMDHIAWLAPQDLTSAERFNALGLPERRLGPVLVLKSAARPVEAAALPFPRHATILAASTHEGEEAIVLDAFLRARASWPDLRLILAPRHPRRREEVETAIRLTGLPFATRSRGEEPAEAVPVYLADTLGEMPLWYSGAGLTFVGGSLVERGGHTPFEPVAYGSAILHGPHVENSAPAYAQLRDARASVLVRDAADLGRAFADLADPARQDDLARRARDALSAFGDADLGPFFDALDRLTGHRIGI